jgi:Ca-activated chloride channel family protein
MRFQFQQLLWLLVVIPPAVGMFYWWVFRKREALMTKFIQARLLPGLISGVSPLRQKIRAACLLASLVFAILALARPQWGYHYEEVTQKGLDILVAIDTSKSMLAEDIAPNRLQRAKLAALDLMQQAKSDRLGLIAFAGGAFLQCPMTIDDSAFRQSVDALDVNSIPQGGTAVAEAIKTATTAFKEQDNYKVMVLFTDGEDNDAGAVAAAQEAAKEGLRIFTIGIGTAEGELLRISDNKGRTDYVRDEQGNVIKSRLNEELLKQIAAATEGGFYLPLRGADTIDVLYERGLAPLPKSEQATRLVRQYHEQYFWPLAITMVLLLVEMLIPETPRRKRPSTVPARGQTATAAASIGILLLFCPGLLQASSFSARRDYDAGNYDQALQEYHRILQNNTNDMRMRFNAGTAAYRNKKYDEAARQFGQGTFAPDLNIQQQSYYNLGNTLYRIGEAISEKKKKIESWEGALKQYEGAIALRTNDADAIFNYEFVKRKLEELKEEEQQQQQQQQGDQENDGGEGQQDQSKNDQQKQQDKQNQESKDQNQQQQSKDQEKDQKEQQAQNQQGQNKEQEQKPQNEQQQQQQPSDQDQQPQQAGARPMTPQEAQQLLDAQKDGEQMLIFQPAEPEQKRPGPIKDW